MGKKISKFKQFNKDDFNFINVNSTTKGGDFLNIEHKGDDMSFNNIINTNINKVKENKDFIKNNNISIPKQTNLNKNINNNINNNIINNNINNNIINNNINSNIFNNNINNKIINNDINNNINTNKKLSDFELYFNKDTHLLDEEGMEKIGKDLDIDIYTNMFFTYFLFKSKSYDLEKITEEEYNRGLNYFKINSIKEYPKDKIINFHLSIDSIEFKEYYLYLYQINKSLKGNYIEFEIVEIYFSQLFNEYDYVKEFLNFIKEKKNSCHITNDQWLEFLELIRLYKTNFPGNYNPNVDSWPSLFDEFYYYYCDNHNIKYEKPEEY